MPLTVRELSPADGLAWDDFVTKHPHGSPFHLLAWKLSIEETFGYTPRYLLVTEAGEIRAVLPLFLVQNPITGRALISSPFAVYGGILATLDAAREAMREHLQQLAISLNVGYVELRNSQPKQCLGFASVTRYVTFTQEIGPNEEAILQAIPRKTRYMVRKSLKNSLTTRIQRENFEAFEALYSQSLRNLGTPSFPTKHFATLMRNFRGQVDVREVLSGDTVIAAVMSFYFRGQVLPYYGASDPRHTHLAPNDFMYYDLMRQAGASGCRLFDFGRSKLGTGAYEFKSHWGMQERSLPYEMLLVGRKDLPNISPTNPKFDLPIRMWQHLPLPVTRALGPLLIRYVP